MEEKNKITLKIEDGFNFGIGFSIAIIFIGLIVTILGLIFIKYYVNGILINH